MSAPDFIDGHAVIHVSADREDAVYIDDLTWEQSSELRSEDAGYVRLYIGHLDHDDYGSMIWYVWVDVDNSVEIEIICPRGGVDVIDSIHAYNNYNGNNIPMLVDNFRVKPPHILVESELGESVGDRVVQRIVNWFHTNYEDPANQLPYESAEGGYQWIWGGPDDAHDVIGDNFSGIPEYLIEQAVNIVQANGLYEWSPIPKPEDYDDAPGDENPKVSAPEIPEQTAHFSFALNGDGKIELAPDAGLPANENSDIQQLKNRLTEALNDLIERLSGSNAHKSIADCAKQYLDVLTRDPLSIDLLYAEGKWFENAVHRINQEIEADGLPQIDPQIGATINMSLSLHGLIITSTSRGKELIQRAKEYADSNTDDQAYRLTARPVIEVIVRSQNLVTAETVNFISRANSEIGEGEHPERSSHIGRTANSNFLAKVGKIIVAGVTLGIITSIAAGVSTSNPGAFVTNLTRETANAAWLFVVDNLRILRELAEKAGPELQWLTYLLDWITPFL